MRQLVYFELLALVGLCALACWRPRRVVERLGPLWVRLDRLARRRRLAIGLVGAFALASAAGLSAVRWPVPRVQDEFSYLLAADTFSRGRLTSPTPPLAEHFDSKHILVRPTYQSKYPPAQGLFLAVGQVLTGAPLVGTWIAWGLACAALTWMLQAWGPPRWALVGGLLAALHFGILDEWHRGRFAYWSQSHWGGAVAMLGGALVFGALRRLLREPKGTHAAVLALGLSVLAASRPYEGLAACLPAAALVAGWTARAVWRGGGRRLALAAAPGLLILAAAGGGLAYYNFRVTGNALRMPHSVHETSSGMRSHFLLSRLRAEARVDEAGGAGEEGPAAAESAERERRSRWLAYEYKRRFAWLWSFFLGPLLTVPFLALPWAWRDRWTLFAAATCGAVTVANLVTVAGFPHYYAPVAGPVVALAVGGLRRLRLLRWGGRPVGRALGAALPLAVAASFVGAVGLHVYWGLSTPYPRIWSEYRASTVSRLSAAGGRHLVVVRSPPPSPARNDEWVYNGADIPSQTVVWARELDEDANERLLAHFRSRTVWFLKADTKRLRFTPWAEREAP